MSWGKFSVYLKNPFSSPKSQFTLVYLIPQELCTNENRCYTMHPSTLFFYLSFVVASVLAGLNLPGLPSKIYGVNLGSWYAFTNHDCFPILNQANYLIRLVLEPWMLPDGSSCESPRDDEDRVALADFWLLEWTQMGGQLCTNNCTTCISTELCVIFWIFYLDYWVTITIFKSAFVQTYPDTADAKFKEHW